MKLIKADYIIAIAFILMLGTHAVTQYLIAKHTSVSVTQKRAEALLTLVEQNPLAAYILQFEKMRITYSLVIAPAFFGGIYYMMRKKYFEKQDVLETFAFTVALATLFNFFNDASYLMGFLAR